MRVTHRGKIHEGNSFPTTIYDSIALLVTSLFRKHITLNSMEKTIVPCSHGRLVGETRVRRNGNVRGENRGKKRFKEVSLGQRLWRRADATPPFRNELQQFNNENAYPFLKKIMMGWE